MDIVRVTDDLTFVAQVPRLLGFQPERSIVIVPVAQGRSVGAMRLDAPDEHPAAHQDVILNALTSIAGVDAVAIVVYDTPLHDDYLSALTALISAIGREVLFCGYVTEGAWTPLGQHDAPKALPAVPGDLLPQADLSAIPAADPALVEQLAASQGALASQVDPVALFEAVATGAEHDPVDLLAALGELAPRNAALAQWATNIATGQDVLHLGQRDTSYPRWVRDIFAGILPDVVPVEGARLTTALDVVLPLASAAAAVPELRLHASAAFATAAWLAWALGRSTSARAYVEQSLANGPGNLLADTVGRFANAGYVAPWAYNARRDRA